MVMAAYTLTTIALLMKVASAIHSHTNESIGNDYEAFPALHVGGLAGCKSGNFNGVGHAGCTGIQRLQCDAMGGCVGTLESKAYMINCNQKHECVTDTWGGTFVRKHMSVVGSNNNGVSVDWNNGCKWVCEDETSKLTQTKYNVCNRCFKGKLAGQAGSGTAMCLPAYKKGAGNWWLYFGTLKTIDNEALATQYNQAGAKVVQHYCSSSSGKETGCSTCCAGGWSEGKNCDLISVGADVAMKADVSVKTDGTPGSGE